MSNYLTRAIIKLKPTAEFSYTNNDYSTIKWDVLEGEAPTKSEVEAAIEEVKADEIAELQAKETARAALLAKLGITAEEVALLLG